MLLRPFTPLPLLLRSALRSRIIGPNLRSKRQCAKLWYTIGDVSKPEHVTPWQQVRFSRTAPIAESDAPTIRASGRELEWKAVVASAVQTIGILSAFLHVIVQGCLRSNGVAEEPSIKI
uniref:Uncharacterized protein n=1 Tax=Trichuris muris TaxID=70415 RepID=A0A5S6QBS0_TRIMR